MPTTTRSARRLVAAQCQGRVLTDVVALEQGGGPRDGQFDDIVIKGAASPAALKAALVGRTLTGTGRRGKTQWATLRGKGGDDLHVLFHFGASHCAQPLGAQRAA